MIITMRARNNYSARRRYFKRHGRLTPENIAIYLERNTRIMEEIKIVTPFIKLDQLIKFAGLAETGAKAKILVELGEFNVNGELCTKRGKKIKPGDTIEFKGKKYKIVLDENAAAESADNAETTAE